MAIFGRRTARQRMRKATQQALSIPAFRTPVDCTPWVLGGLWPAELDPITPQNSSLAAYLKNDLQRIADSANQKLQGISAAGLIEPARQAEEARVVNVARAFAVLRVESTIRHLRKEPLGFQPEYLSLGVVPDEPTMIVPIASAATKMAELRTPAAPSDPHIIEADPPAVEPAAPRVIEHEVPEVIDAIEVVENPEPLRGQIIGERPSTTQRPAVREAAARSEPDVCAEPVPRPPTSGAELAVPRPQSGRTGESSDHRLQRMLEFVARQEPGLRWAVGDRADGTTVLVTDLAHGWIPPGIDLPSGVELLSPQRRASGNLLALLGTTERSATYRPGDGFGDATEYDVTVPSTAVRCAELIDDLGWKLTEATQWRGGLPRIAHTLAKAGAAGTGVVDAELDVLRVHLDTTRYQVFAQYPRVQAALLSNCLLLAATEAIATGQSTAANYHFAWFLEFNSATPDRMPGSWGTQP